MSEDKPRSFEVAIEIDAPPSEVWKAIAGADGIARWFAPEVKVVPGEGGSIFVSWGPGMEGTYTIETWQQDERLCLTEYRATPYACTGEQPAAEAEPAPRRIAVDYYLESKAGGGTILRLVQSGFGNSEGWDQEMESTKRGWPTFFRVMKHGIEFHPGEPAKPVTLSINSPHQAEEAWTRFQHALSLPAGMQTYTIELPAESIHGTLLIHGERHFAGVVEEWNNALVSIVCEPFPNVAGSMLFFMLTLYGPAIEQADAISKRWTESLTNLVS